MTWANDFEDRRSEPGPFGVGVATLMIGVALGAGAALLLAAPGSQDIRSRLSSGLRDWQSSAAEALARGRERLIKAVEQDYGSAPGDRKPSGGQNIRPA